MSYSILYIIIIAVALIGGVATFIIGYSKANKVASSEYSRKTNVNLKKLTYFYGIVIVLAIAAFIWYLNL
ncbi:hypothetical protein [Paenibacillus crassostreae]|uniref:Uncharacterized protein n=1 Tax=Paenibacillus crassostreae TaxID=1763538 RepID=A0A167FFF7_9BACL|nr:hypothetical protein [Paenibacillus crassostreae]AOZ94461.1 hypothetical protein LPB68_21170 [Paenibacillus crassostreae]OAB76501.1 hypothetical protein PNBC_03570 [Paenibacillus crassostreae]